MKTKYILLISVIFAIASCKKDATPAQKEYPEVLLNKITEISSKGVTFKATVDYLSKYEILDYGFVWSENVPRPTISDFKISLGTALKGSFSADVNTDLAAGKKYNVRAYVQNSKYLVYSKEEVFTSLGSLAPEISSFTPVKGLDGTIVTIKGKNFSKTLSRNIVKIGSAASVVLYADENEIHIMTPFVEYSGNFKITVKVAEQTASSASDYTIIGPIISSISTVQVKQGDIVTVTGKNFKLAGKQTLVSITGKDANIISLDTNKIIVTVPIIRYYETLTSGLKVIIGNKIASNDLSLLQTWFSAKILRSTAERNDLFSINTKGYCISNKKLYEYIPENDTWNFKSDFPGNISSKSFKFVIDHKLYMGGGLNGQINSKEFWVYDQDSNGWTQLNDIYNSTSYSTSITPISFSLNGLGYIWSYNGNFWCYNPVTGQWTQKNNIPDSNSINSAVIMNNKAFLIHGKSLWEYDVANDKFSLKTTCPYDITSSESIALQDNYFVMREYGFLYRYNATLDIWTYMQDYPCPGRVVFPVFTLGNKIYFGNFGGGENPDCQYSFNYMIP